ncbi:hypothetical protein F4808DRAFT_429240 [Astrocystis sublimbata]|nr:hypothetical protein F4808DRAFT_429240 [Astrocystis sublimbata]
MPGAHDTFKALGPVDWEAFAQEDLATHMTSIFGDAHDLIDTVPAPAGDADVESEPSDHVQRLGKEWKEVKVNARDNPHKINIYKLSAKDGRGAWFARRSVHDGVQFGKWKTGMVREFAETLKIQGQPGDGKIRGLAAEKRVEDKTVEGCGNIQVYQLSAQFPGPTTPRDFVTLCLSSDTPNGPGKLRSYMLVSKPCVHPECPQRQGFIRGYYESVEIIREIKVEKAQDTSGPLMDATNKASLKTSGSNSGEGKSTKHEELENQDDGTVSTIEWLMITRSDPGGSVPRFMIEKKTPEGIVTDAGKFIEWMSSKRYENMFDSNYDSTKATGEADQTTIPTPVAPLKAAAGASKELKAAGTAETNYPESPGAGGVYGMISGALGMLASAAASRLLGPPEDDASESESGVSSPTLDDDTSSLHSFHSLDPTENEESTAKTGEGKEAAPSMNSEAGEEIRQSSESTSTRSVQQEKELKKLEERKRKAEEKLRREQERALAKQSDDAQRDQLALQKLREKHEREVAKQEEKYQRGRQKLEAKRASEEKKAEDRRRKQAEREMKANLSLELEKARAERDVVCKRNEALTEQVGQLQAKLVARLGHEGIAVDDVVEPAQSELIGEKGVK